MSMYIRPPDRRIVRALAALAAGLVSFAAAAEAKRIVILGSSTAAGAGSTAYQRSWAGRLTEALAKRGHTVVNVSVSGHGTQDAINRFASTVAPLKPDFVVLATSVFNEGFPLSPSPAMATYRSNLVRLTAMVREIGAVPVVIGQYPNRAYREEHKRLIAGLHAWLDEAGQEPWDFWDALATADGDWAPGLTMDGTHPLDAGHAYMFDAIPLTFVDAATRNEAAPRPSAWRFLGNEADGAEPLWVELDRAAGSWTQSGWFLSAPQPRAALFANDSELAVVRLDGTLLVLDGVDNPLLSTDWTDDTTAHHVALAYSATLREVRLFVDGIDRGSSAVASAPATRFVFAGRTGRSELDCAGCTLSMPAIHRAALNQGDAVRMAAGEVPRKSLEVYLPLAAQPSRFPANLARTTTAAVAQGNWEAAGEPKENDNPACPSVRRPNHLRSDCR